MTRRLWQTMLASLGLISMFLTLYGASTSAIWKSSTTKHQAPFQNKYDPLERHIPEEYGIYLAQGYSVEQHSATVQHDITPHIRTIFGFNEDKLVYWGQRIDEELLSVIRADPNVELVDGNPRVDLSDDRGGGLVMVVVNDRYVEVIMDV